MQFKSLIGQPVAQAILAAALSTTRTSHAYLFSGPEGTGKSACAVEFARALCGAALYPHPDILIFEPDGATFKIDQARKVQKELALSPLAGGRRVAIIHHVDKMTTEAANSLLKILEDPPSTSVLVLIATHLSNVLPTVQSRCQVVPFRPAPLPDVHEYLLREGIESGRAKALAALSGGIIGKALALSTEDGGGKTRSVGTKCLEDLSKSDPWTLASSVPQERAEALDVLAYIAWMLRDAVATGAGSPGDVVINMDRLGQVHELSGLGSVALHEALSEVTRAKRRIERNCNVACTLELMFIKMQRLLKR